MTDMPQALHFGHEIKTGRKAASYEQLLADASRADSTLGNDISATPSCVHLLDVSLRCPFGVL